MTEPPQTKEPAFALPAGTDVPTFHVGMDELPWVDLGEGTELQILHVDLTSGLWVTRNRFKPGTTIDRHYHSGLVFAVTLQGSWYYAEEPEAVNRRGSYLFEPPSSIHTLTVPADQDEDTIVWFAIYGSIISLHDDDTPKAISDARLVLDGYRAYGAAIEHSLEGLIVIGDS